MERLQALIDSSHYRTYDQSVDIYTDFIYYRTPHRLLGGALLGCAVCLPTSAIAFQSTAFHRFRAVMRIPFFMPMRVRTAALIGAVGGALEDCLVRVSYEETMNHRRPVDVSNVKLSNVKLRRLFVMGKC
jgi:hypothetical protein